LIKPREIILVEDISNYWRMSNVEFLKRLIESREISSVSHINDMWRQLNSQFIRQLIKPRVVSAGDINDMKCNEDSGNSPTEAPSTLIMIVYLSSLT
jgi:hypothetical protein